MLFLDRKKNQSIELYNKKTGEVIHVIILDVHGGNIRLGFEDPTNSCTILRKEVRQRNEGSATPNPFYDDRIPNTHKPSIQKELESDPLMTLLDELIPTQLPPTQFPTNTTTPIEGVV